MHGPREAAIENAVHAKYFYFANRRKGTGLDYRELRPIVEEEDFRSISSEDWDGLMMSSLSHQAVVEFDTGLLKVNRRRGLEKFYGFEVQVGDNWKPIPGFGIQKLNDLEITRKIRAFQDWDVAGQKVVASRPQQTEWRIGWKGCLATNEGKIKMRADIVAGVREQGLMHGTKCWIEYECNRPFRIIGGPEPVLIEFEAGQGVVRIG